MAATRFDNIKANTQIGTLTIHKGNEVMKFGTEDFADKTIEIPVEYNDSAVRESIQTLVAKVSALESAPKTNVTITPSSVSDGANTFALPTFATINGQTITSGGNIVISGGSSDELNDDEFSQLTNLIVAEESARISGDDQLHTRITALESQTSTFGNIVGCSFSILSQAAYDAIEEKDVNTFYFIIDTDNELS